MKKTLRFAAWILLAVFLAAAILPALLSHHDCAGEDCRVCRVLSLCRGAVKALFCAAVLLVFAAPLFRALLQTGAEQKLSRSPVAFKVKLLN